VIHRPIRTSFYKETHPENLTIQFEDFDYVTLNQFYLNTAERNRRKKNKFMQKKETNTKSKHENAIMLSKDMQQ
jgi:hypothetical protein